MRMRMVMIAGALAAAGAAWGQGEGARARHEAWDAVEAARSLRMEGKPELALAALERIGTDFPDAPADVAVMAERYKGFALWDRKEYAGMQAAFEGILRDFEGNPDVPRWMLASSRMNLGYALAHQGRRDEALTQYWRILEDYPGTMDHEVLLYIGRTLMGQGKEQEAVEVWESALLDRGRINQWTDFRERIFRAIPVRPEREQAYREFCRSLNFLILPVEENIEIKTLLKRIADGQ